MSSLISEVIKDTIKEAMANKITLTPDNYAQVFCEQAAKRGLSTPECYKLKNYISRLDENTQKELAKMPVRTEAELFAFLSAKLKRASMENSQKSVPALQGLCKNVLSGIKLLRNKEAKELAGTTLGALESNPSEANIGILKDKWQSFINSYDDSYLDDLKKFGIAKSDDLKAIVSALMSSNIEISANKNYYEIAEVLLESLKPSITTSMSEDIEKISKKLQSMPELIENKLTQKEIKGLIDKRLGLDRGEFKNKFTSLDKILCDIEEQIQNYTKKMGGNENKELIDIRKELEELGSGNLDEFKNVKNKLENVASSISFSLKDFEGKLNESKQAISTLKEEIRKLQEQLEASAKEATSDFLTGLLTKRALEKELERVDSDYIDKDIEYCICFFDIDHFKKINDTYGHSAGDVILAKVGNILQKNSRKIDVVARFGGEEFVAILPLCDLEDARAYAQGILSSIGAFEFIYKDTKFSITISCGISSRTQTKSYKSCMEAADNMLYAAKDAGRNCVKIYEQNL